MKPLTTKTTIPRNVFLWALVGLLTLAGIIALVSAFSGGDDGADEVNAVYTNAAATLVAQQMTLQASVPQSTSTTAASPTSFFTPTSSPTLSTQPLLPTNTTAPSSGGAVSGAVGCNNSAYVADVTFPDDTVVTPGQSLTKTWKLQNTGSCPWTATYKVTFVSGNVMGGSTTPIGITVGAGQSGDISVKLTAPSTAGDAIGYWILTNDNNQNFGTTFYIKIKVGAATGTSTATPTPTATATTNSYPGP